MNLSDTIKFIAPAICKKNSTLPVLNHVRFVGGYAIAYDSELAMCCPCDLPLTASPQGWTLEKAVEQLGQGYQVVQLPNGDLEFVSSDKGAKRRIIVPCTTDEFPMPDFNYTNPLPAPSDFRSALRSLLPFMFDKEDANRPWVRTILLRHRKAVATSGHTIAWRPLDIPEDVDVNIPRKAVEAIVSTKDDPAWIACTPTRFVAIYNDGRFLSTPSVSTPWPTKIADLIQPVQIHMDIGPLFAALASIAPFIPRDESFYCVNGTVATEPDGRGASCEIVLPAIMEGKHIAGDWYRQCAKVAKRFSAHGTWLAWDGDEIEGRSMLGKTA